MPSGGRIPAYPLVTITQLQRRCAEPEPAKPAMLRADQKAHLRPHQRPSTLRVFTDHQLIPHAHLRKVVDLDQRESTNIVYPVWNVARSLHGFAQTPRTLGTATSSIKRCGQHDVTGTLQLAQRLDTACGLAALSGIKEAKMPAH